MRCMFCAEDVREEALVCRHCGNDLTMPPSLAAENAHLKERVASLQRELAELGSKIAVLKKNR